MLDIIDDIKRWSLEGKPFALATVVKTWRSAPRGVGACMIVDPDGKMIGSVSGGCVEGQVVKEALNLIQSGETSDLSFGVSNDDAWSVGLSCGGAISVHIQPFFGTTDTGAGIWSLFLRSIERDKGCVLIYGNGSVGYYAASGAEGPFPEEVFNAAEMTLDSKTSQMLELDQKNYFFHVFPPKNRLIIIGAAHITRDLVALARQQDFEVFIIDPRGLFYESLAGLVGENSLRRQWPADALPEMILDDSTFAVLLTHDPKIDDQALHILLRSDVAYIGALGSRKTHQRRVARLLDAGFSQSDIGRVHGPVGLDIEAGSPAEIALSIMAEIIKVKNTAIKTQEN